MDEEDEEEADQHCTGLADHPAHHIGKEPSLGLMECDHGMGLAIVPLLAESEGRCSFCCCCCLHKLHRHQRERSGCGGDEVC